MDYTVKFQTEIHSGNPFSKHKSLFSLTRKGKNKMQVIYQILEADNVLVSIALWSSETLEFYIELQSPQRSPCLYPITNRVNKYYYRAVP